MNRSIVLYLIAGCLLGLALLGGTRRHGPAPAGPGPPPVLTGKLLYFSASWCAPCSKMQATLSDPAVIARLQQTRVTIERYDVDHDRELAARHAVTAAPTYVLLDPTGKEIRRGAGYKSPADFVAWMDGRTLPPVRP